MRFMKLDGLYRARLTGAIVGFGATMLICMLASTLAIRVALRVDPAQAIS